MKWRYTLSPLSPGERQRLNEILLEEMDTQHWFTVAFSLLYQREIFLHLQ